MYKLKPAKLILSNGITFSGYSLGAVGESIGEVCFNTGMTGYQEVFTDPSYSGQLMITTNAHIGNYGYSQTEIESDSMKISCLLSMFTI